MHRSNNFDFLRLLFASFVIITHSYPLTGNKECDLFCQIFNGQSNLSYIGVRGFFVISGYLIFQSLLNSKTILNYYWKRVLRIFPALIAVLMLSTIFCFFAYTGFNNYWSNSSTWTYAPKNIFFYFYSQPEIDGVFEGNRYRPAINGSLWTIPYEFTGYLLVSCFYFIRKRDTLLKLFLGIIVVVLLIFAMYFPNRGGNFNFIADFFGLGNNLFINLFCYFFMGSFLATLKLEKLSQKTKYLFFFISIIATFISLKLNVFDQVQFVGISLSTIFFCISSTPYLNRTGKILGDLSYGIYIFSFPVQQFIEYFYKPSVLEMIFVSFAITVILAHFSWIFIEKQALKFKNIVR